MEMSEEEKKRLEERSLQHVKHKPEEIKEKTPDW